MLNKVAIKNAKEDVAVYVYPIYRHIKTRMIKNCLESESPSANRYTCEDGY